MVHPSDGEPTWSLINSDHLSPSPRYNARVASTKQPLGAASLQAASATKGQALLNATFAMTVPADVNVLSWSSFPKLTTQPVFNSATRVLTWTLGSAVVKPGRSAKLSFKMQPTACTTPDALALNGRFDFTDGVGAQTVDACLKKRVHIGLHVTGGAGGRRGGHSQARAHGPRRQKQVLCCVCFMCFCCFGRR